MTATLLSPLLGGLVLLLSVLPPTVRAQQPPELDLFEVLPVHSRAASAGPASPIAEEPPPMTVRLRPEAVFAVRPGSRLRLALGPGVLALAEVKDVHTTLLGRRVVAGGIVGRPSGRLLLVFDARNGEAAATLTLSAEEHYVLGRAPDAVGLEVRRASVQPLPVGPVADDAVLPPTPHLPSAPRPRALAPTGDAGPADAPDRYDLLIVYTAAARAAAGGTAAMELLCELAAENCNQCYANSGLSLRGRLVHTMESAYRESNSYDADLDRLASGTLVNSGDVAAARDQYGADFVSLFVGGEGAAQDGGTAGKAYLNTSPDANHAFSICNQRFAADLTLAHEIGHNMGCAHDAANAAGFGTPAYPFSYGWRWTGANGRLYRDVMAYAPGIQEPLFSSPQVNSAGGVAGDAAQADNARTIRENAPAFANYRRATVGVRPLVSLSVTQRESYKDSGQPARLVVTRAGTDLGQPLEVGLYVPSLTADNAGALLDPAPAAYYALDQAVPGLDFTAPAKVTIPAGAASAEIALTPMADPARRRTRDRPEPATVTLLPGDGYDLGNPAMATAFVYEHTQGLVVSAPSPRAIQNPSTSAQVVISRTGADDAALGSPLEIWVNAFGNANPRADYSVNLRSFPPNATIAAGAQSVTLTVTALPGANLPAAGKPLDFFVEDYSGGQPYHYDPLQRATVALLPSPPVLPPAVVSLTASAPRVAEGGPALKLYFARAGGDPNVDLTVTYQVSGAGAGRVTALPGTVTIPAGSTKAKVNLRATDDGVSGGDQVLKVTVLAAEGYAVGSPAKAKLVVGDPAR